LNQEGKLPGSLIKSYRLDRIANSRETGQTGWFIDYGKQVQNLAPATRLSSVINELSPELTSADARTRVSAEEKLKDAPSLLGSPETPADRLRRFYQTALVPESLEIEFGFRTPDGQPSLSQQEIKKRRAAEGIGNGDYEGLRRVLLKRNPELLREILSPAALTPGTPKYQKAKRIERSMMRGVQYSPKTLTDEQMLQQKKPLNIKAFHGTPSGGFSSFKNPENRLGVFFTDQKSIAQEYTRERGLWLSPGKNPQVIEASLKMSNPLEIDALGARNNNIPIPGKEWKPTVFGRVPKDSVSVEDAAQMAFEQGYDGLIVKNVKDSVYPDTKKNSTVYVVKSADQISGIGTTKDAEINLERELIKQDLKKPAQ
ncbi:MAG: hypothetical protein EBR82_73720, partial [Caulobacteraceae bacterium]|nr:hypothetical protein [Caulobacteraceae bacterium]